MRIEVVYVFLNITLGAMLVISICFIIGLVIPIIENDKKMHEIEGFKSEIDFIHTEQSEKLEEKTNYKKSENLQIRDNLLTIAKYLEDSHSQSISYMFSYQIYLSLVSDGFKFPKNNLLSSELKGEINKFVKEAKK